MNIKKKLKHVIVEGLRIETVSPDEIDDNEPIFGEKLGLDSIDALELVALMEEHFGIVIRDMKQGREMMSSINNLAAFIEKQREKP